MVSMLGFELNYEYTIIVSRFFDFIAYYTFHYNGFKNKKTFYTIKE